MTYLREQQKKPTVYRSRNNLQIMFHFCTRLINEQFHQRVNISIGGHVYSYLFIFLLKRNHLEQRLSSNSFGQMNITDESACPLHV